MIACVVSLMLGLSGCSSVKTQRDVAIVPTPLSMEKGTGSFTFGPNTVITVPTEEQKPVAGLFASLFTRSAGFTPKVQVGTEGDVCLELGKNLPEDAYEMQVSSGQIRVKASDSKGLFYGLQNLRLLLPPAIESSTAQDTVEWTVPEMTVKDAPRFGYRGFMLDVSRYFLPKEELLRMIDCMALLKLNRLHLHLTDDNGWRLEIKKYPKLTEVGAWKVDRQHLPFPERRNPKRGEPATVGGYYTQADMKEIIAYAADRQIEIIPEIDIPAHSNAALASYPEYACPVVKDFIGVIPGLGGKNAEIIFCGGNEKTYEFLQDVLDEVIALFPSRYIHLGGDEATKTNWKKCPLCQARIREEHLADEEALQGYFMERMSDYVRSKGKEVMGWDELTNSKLPEDAIIFGWQGFGNAALKAAEQGHRFVMTPARVAYLIRYQGPQWFEPLTYFGNNTLKGLFDYEPVQEGWKPEYEKLLMGVQASMWTEFCNKPEDVFYLVFPRLAALAEIAWVPKNQKDWNVFLKGLDNYTAHLEQKDVVYARSMFNIQHRIIPNDNGALTLTLECERPDVDIHYTLDGTEPTATSPRYTQALTLKENVTVKAATFAGNEQQGKTLILPVEWNKATAKPLVNAASGMEVLVNGLRGSLKQTDFEWYTGAMSVTVDLQQPEDIRSCTAGCITNYGMAVHKPKSMTVELSDDNLHFKEAGKLTFTDDEIFREGNFIEDLRIDVDHARARYIRFTFEAPSNCPADHVRPGQPSRVYLDELIIR
ncbi:family 20 glycosylhydrolase [Phocaeicola barnesiae]|uniref:beta-N-acetylhexosaminidase n=1 Tax=Phocaeicola barnesiae TaxID=376804 RepID=UPI00374CCD43|nr:family 20 glycosylhydrolase [Phocaeicola barnesiae]